MSQSPIQLIKNEADKPTSKTLETTKINLVTYLYIVKRLVRDDFTRTGWFPLPTICPLTRKGSLSCHTCFMYDRKPRFPRHRPVEPHPRTNQGYGGPSLTYSLQDPICW